MQFKNVISVWFLSQSPSLCGLRSAEAGDNQLKVHCHAYISPLMRKYM